MSESLKQNLADYGGNVTIELTDLLMLAGMIIFIGVALWISEREDHE